MGQICLFYGKIPKFFFLGFLFSISISGDSVSSFMEMIMFINLECTLTQTRMGFGRVTLPSKGPMTGQFVFFMAK